MARVSQEECARRMEIIQEGIEAGKTAKDLAAELGVQPQTVRKYMAQIVLTAPDDTTDPTVEGRLVDLEERVERVAATLTKIAALLLESKV